MKTTDFVGLGGYLYKKVDETPLVRCCQTETRKKIYQLLTSRTDIPGAQSLNKKGAFRNFIHTQAKLWRIA